MLITGAVSDSYSCCTSTLLLLLVVVVAVVVVLLLCYSVFLFVTYCYICKVDVWAGLNMGLHYEQQEQSQQQQLGAVIVAVGIA